MHCFLRYKKESACLPHNYLYSNNKYDVPDRVHDDGMVRTEKFRNGLTAAEEANATSKTDCNLAAVLLLPFKQ